MKKSRTTLSLSTTGLYEPSGAERIDSEKEKFIEVSEGSRQLQVKEWKMADAEVARKLRVT